VRVQYVQQGLGDFRKFVVQLVLHPARQQSANASIRRSTLGIVAGIRLQLQTARHARMLLRKLAGHLPDEPEFPLVVGSSSSLETLQKRRSAATPTAGGSKTTGSARVLQQRGN
jgi:hypothetical protein